MTSQMTVQPETSLVSNSSTAYDWTVTAGGLQSETPVVPLGTVVFDIYGREWMYCRAEGAVTAGYICSITTDGNFDATVAATSDFGTPGTHWKLAGISNINVTDEYCAWFWIGSGFFEAYVEASFTAADVVYTTDVAGVIGADNSSFQIEGLKVIDTTTSAARVTVWAADRLTVGVVEAHD